MSNRPLLVAVERCQVCGKTRKQFFCSDCVTDGNFVRSSFVDGGDQTSFAGKKKKLKIITSVRNEYIGRLQKHLDLEKVNEDKVLKQLWLKKQIETLKLVLDETKKQTQIEISKVEQVSSNVSQRRLFIAKMVERTENIKTSSKFKEKKLKVEQCKEKLLQKHADLKLLRRKHVQALTTDIFPLSQREVFPELGTPPRDNITTDVICTDVISEGLSSTEKELEEATRTVHIGGQWISQNASHTEHTIVGVGMPASGDFQKYFEWLKSYRNEPRNTESPSSLHEVSLLNIPASLMYTAQFVDRLSFFLGVNLPNKFEYSHFGLLQVSRQRLFQTINKLSQNIMYLAFSQLVPSQEVHPSHLLQNIKFCISGNNENLGRIGPFEVFQYELMDCPFDSDSSAEELNFESGSDTENIEQEEWDKLIDLPPDPRDMTPSASFIEYNRDRSLSSSASGLVTSAAASFASALWSLKRQ